MSIQEAISKFVAHVDAVAKQSYGEQRAPRHEAVTLSDKWVRIERRDVGGSGRSVYCFVALADYETKGLGKVKTGDIHKSAGFKSASKHARGSVLDESTWGCAGPYGVAYRSSNGKQERPLGL